MREIQEEGLLCVSGSNILLIVSYKYFTKLIVTILQTLFVWHSLQHIGIFLVFGLTIIHRLLCHDGSILLILHSLCYDNESNLIKMGQLTVQLLIFRYSVITTQTD